MSEQDKTQLFEDQPIRAAWDSEQEEWYFSIVNVIRALTDSPNPQTYWRVMKKRLKDEGNETVTNRPVPGSQARTALQAGPRGADWLRQPGGGVRPGVEAPGG